ncbi:periplasmic heavy metal sensor [Candidatus Sumerlaeota bacterium]|nr:periplasmic heavy metal sensor [Candidatus Sumerlaeota bacterium]
MRNSWKKAVVAMIPILILCFAVSVSAQDISRALGNERLAKELNLTPEQKESLKKIQLDSREKRIDVDARLQKARLQFEQEIQKDETNEGKIMELVEAMGAAQTDLRKISVTELIEAKKTLTPEQREKAKNLVAKWKALQARQKFQQRIHQPGKPERQGWQQQGAINRNKGRADMPGRQRPDIRRQRPGLNPNLPARKGDRSQLMEFPPDPLFDDAPETNLANLPVPDPDFDDMN